MTEFIPPTLEERCFKKLSFVSGLRFLKGETTHLLVRCKFAYHPVTIKEAMNVLILKGKINRPLSLPRKSKVAAAIRSDGCIYHHK